jgi:hypothetical protein
MAAKTSNDQGLEEQESAKASKQTNLKIFLVLSVCKTKHYQELVLHHRTFHLLDNNLYPPRDKLGVMCSYMFFSIYLHYSN